MEHRAKPDASLEGMRATAYVTEEYTKEIAKHAGFEFEVASEINANPRDTTDHPDGAWSLPPFFVPVTSISTWR